MKLPADIHTHLNQLRNPHEPMTDCLRRLLGMDVLHKSGYKYKLYDLPVMGRMYIYCNKTGRKLVNKQILDITKKTGRKFKRYATFGYIEVERIE